MSFLLEISVDIRMVGLMLSAFLFTVLPLCPVHLQVEKTLREGTSTVVI